MGQVVRQQTHLCVIGHVHLVIRVGEAHPSWGLDIQHVGNLGGGGNEQKRGPQPFKYPDIPTRPTAPGVPGSKHRGCTPG